MTGTDRESQFPDGRTYVVLPNGVREHIAAGRPVRSHEGWDVLTLCGKGSMGALIGSQRITVDPLCSVCERRWEAGHADDIMTALERSLGIAVHHV